MRYLLILMLVVQAQALTKQCEVATAEAIKVHVLYMDDKATLTDSYNAEAKSEKVCKDQ